MLMPPGWCPVSRRPVPAVGHKTADFCSATVRWSPSPGVLGLPGGSQRQGVCGLVVACTCRCGLRVGFRISVGVLFRAAGGTTTGTGTP